MAQGIKCKENEQHVKLYKHKREHTNIKDKFTILKDELTLVKHHFTILKDKTYNDKT